MTIELELYVNQEYELPENWKRGQSLPESPEEVKDGAIRRCFVIVDASKIVTDDEKVCLEFLFVWAFGVCYAGDVSAVPYLDAM